ncbi:type III secretion chaperone SycN [Chromobacterium vaccinii]|uniref:type III secretion chaperone SycN n=1 Tax=Chromobacterium vaccinii TaxID=1108595 RepID=UPI003C7478D7
MELQTARRLEQFLQLSELPTPRVEPRMEFSMPPFRLYIEYLDGRVLLSLGRRVEHVHQGEALKQLLVACQPARTQGTPLRAYILREQLVLSCAPASGSETNHWLACVQTMRRLLEATAGDA